MALPTVHFHSAAADTNSSLLSVWMAKLDDMLVNDAGWERSFVDADAIGGGSAGAPAWDKTPAGSTDAGVAVYRMPANGLDTRWYVRLRPGWAVTTNRPHMRGVQVGTTHDGSGNVSGGSAEAAPTVTTAQTDNRQILMAVSEDGFFFTLPNSSSSAVNVLVERARRSDTGVVTDDLLVLNTFSGAAAALARAGVGEVHSATPIVLGGFNNGTTPSTFGSGASLQNYDGSHVPIVGPFWVRGFPFFHPRLAFLVNPGDHAVNTDRDLSIDGAAKTYRSAGTAQGANWAVWAVATE